MAGQGWIRKERTQEGHMAPEESGRVGWGGGENKTGDKTSMRVRRKTQPLTGHRATVAKDD